MEAVVPWELITQIISGPASATVILCVIMGATGYWGLPLLRDYLKDQRAALDLIMREHKEDREVFQKAFSELTIEIKGMAAAVTQHSARIEKIEDTIECKGIPSRSSRNSMYP